MDVVLDVVVPIAGVAVAVLGVLLAWRFGRSADKQAARASQDDRLRHQREQLEKIQHLVLLIRSDAMEATKAAIARGDGPSDTWRTASQGQLAGALTGVPDLPRCLSLTQAKGIGTVTAAAIAAEQEVQAAFGKLQSEWAAPDAQ